MGGAASGGELCLWLNLDLLILATSPESQAPVLSSSHLDRASRVTVRPLTRRWTQGLGAPLSPCLVCRKDDHSLKLPRIWKEGTIGGAFWSDSITGIQPFTCLPIHPPIILSLFHPSIHHPSLHPFIPPFIFLSVHQSIHLSTAHSATIHPSLHPSTHLSIILSIHPFTEMY